MSLITDKKPKREGHNAGKDRYLITYADLITLLLGLFVILYASAQVDTGKFKAFSQAFSQYFKANPPGVLDGSDGVLDGSKSLPEPSMVPTQPKSLNEFKAGAEKSLAKFIESGQIQIRQTETELTLVMPEKLMFESAKSDIQAPGITALDTLASLLSDENFQITIDGHTDAVPIRSFQYESNWHLSLARAMSVSYKLMTLGVPERNFVVRGFGAQRPIADNVTAEGKAKNRRVEITLSAMPAEAPTNGNKLAQ